MYDVYDLIFRNVHDTFFFYNVHTGSSVPKVTNLSIYTAQKAMCSVFKYLNILNRIIR